MTCITVTRDIHDQLKMLVNEYNETVGPNDQALTFGRAVRYLLDCYEHDRGSIEPGMFVGRGITVGKVE